MHVDMLGMIIEANRSLLLLVDLQSRLAPAIVDAEACVDQCLILLSAARALGVPVRASEHCPAALGATLPALGDRLKPGEVLPKVHFNGAAEPALYGNLQSLDRPTVVVCGMETHVCVLQTVLGLKGRGLNPVLVVDATSSRMTRARDMAIERMRHHGIDIVSTEMVMFEWLERGDAPAFKALLPMIKSGKPDRPA
jgi:nicotinamidase-related amidase